MRRETRGQLLIGPAEAGTLALALVSLSEVEFRIGDWQAAYASAVEALRLAHASGRREELLQGLTSLALVQAGLGREEACRRHGEQGPLALADRQADHSCAVLARAALGLLELGLGRPDEAIGWLEPLTHAPGHATGTWVCDLAEALIRRGDNECAEELLAALGNHPAQPRDLATRRALERCRGLLAPEYDSRRTAPGRSATRYTSRSRSSGPAPSSASQRLRRTGQRVAARQRLRAALASAIYTVNADGGEPRLVRRVPPDRPGAGSPNSSPDGSRLLFSTYCRFRGASCGQAPTGAQLFTVKPNGRGLRQLTHLPGNSYNPAWSPEGSKVVFARNRTVGPEADLYTMNADGTQVRRITRAPKLRAQWPDWRTPLRRH